MVFVPWIQGLALSCAAQRTRRPSRSTRARLAHVHLYALDEDNFHLRAAPHRTCTVVIYRTGRRTLRCHPLRALPTLPHPPLHYLLWALPQVVPPLSVRRDERAHAEA